MKHGSEIWLGELLRSWQALAPGDEATQAAVARLLGFELAAIEAPPPEPVAPAPLPEPARPERAAHASAASQAAARTACAAALRARSAARQRAAARARSATRMAGGRSARPRRYRGPPAAAPPELFRPEWARTLVTTLAARRLPGRAIDEARLVRELANGHPLRRIPRLRRWTLTLGVQLLIDVSPGMEAFAADQIALSERFVEAVGEAHMEEWLFADCPLRGVFADADDVAWRAPQPGVPVVAVSDLGLGAPPDHLARAGVQEWLEFAARLAARGSRLTVLSPWPRAHVPSALGECIAFVEWDRPTSAAQVRRLLERHDVWSVKPGPTPGSRCWHGVAPMRSSWPGCWHPRSRSTRPCCAACGSPCCPHGAWIEAELWHSPLVKARSAGGLRFEPAVSERLREQLAAAWQADDEGERQRILEARGVMAAVHTGLSPALALEERVAWAAVMGELDEIEEALASAVKGVLDGSRPGLAAWAGQAVARLPAESFETSAGQALRLLAAQAGHATATRPEGVSPTRILSELPLARLGISRRGPLLVLGVGAQRAGFALPVPDSEPRLVEVLWQDEDDRLLRMPHAIAGGEAQEIEVGHARCSSSMSLGEAFECRASSAGRGGAGYGRLELASRAAMAWERVTC